MLRNGCEAGIDQSQHFLISRFDKKKAPLREGPDSTGWIERPHFDYCCANTPPTQNLLSRASRSSCVRSIAKHLIPLNLSSLKWSSLPDMDDRLTDGEVIEGITWHIPRENSHAITADGNPRCISDAALQDRRSIVVDGNGDYIAEILGSDHIDRGEGAGTQDVHAD